MLAMEREDRPVPSIGEAMIRGREHARIESVTLDGRRMLVTGKTINRIRERQRLTTLAAFRDDQVYLLTDGNDQDLFETA